MHLLARCWPTRLAHSLLEVGDDLDRSKARQRLSYVRHHPAQLAFFRRVDASGMRLSVRRAGLWNDLQQFARLPVCPLERISCPTLVVHGRADGNVPLAHAEFVAGTVPNAELLALDDCGHIIWIGPKAGRVAGKVRDFLIRHPPLAASRRRQADRPRKFAPNKTPTAVECLDRDKCAGRTRSPFR